MTAVDGGSAQKIMFASIAENLADIGAISLEDYLNDHCEYTQPDGDVVAQLRQACQRSSFRFEFIEQGGSRQCILSITKPDGVQRSYATEPVFTRKSDAKSDAARIAIEMGALDFLSADTAPTPTPDESPNLSPETFIDDIEQCCLEWRAGRVAPRWVPFFNLKSAHKQGCALSIRLSPHVVCVYLSEPTFDTHSEAKKACAKAAALEGVLDFIKYGNGQTRPTSPTPSASSVTLPHSASMPLTLQTFYDTLPKPFPESFGTTNASEINAPAWLNSLVQNARGGKLILSFYFTSDGPPGLCGCLLKLDRLGEYKAFLVDARFTKRADAKAAVCLQAMSHGIGNYVRSIVSSIESKVTPIMRSFSSSLVYSALTSELTKIATGLHPCFEYHKERDAFGATLVVRLSTSPAPDQVRRYTVSNEYRNKADAKVAVICCAAEQGVVEFVRFRGGTPPDRYTSPYVLHTYNPETCRKRKRHGSVEDAEQGRPTKKKKGKQRADASSAQPSGDQVHGISCPGDMGLPQSVPLGASCDPSQLGVGGGGGSGVARRVAYGHGVSHGAPPYPAMLATSFAGRYGIPHGGESHPPGLEDLPSPESGPSRVNPGASLRPARDEELEPGEVVSSAESEFSVSSSRKEDDDEGPAREEDAERTDDTASVTQSQAKGKGKEKSMSPATQTTGEGPGTVSGTSTSHVKRLVDVCAARHCGSPSFHETQRRGRYHVWIVIGKERFDLPTTYTTAEEGRQRVAKQVLARLSKGSDE